MAEIQNMLTDFLKITKSQLVDIDSINTIHAVLGNEACDLDSAVAAVAYAFYLFKKNQSPTTLYLPILNILSEEYRLRTEVNFALDLYKLTADLLTFRDQIDLAALRESQKVLKLTLVDFNVFRGKDQNLDSAVCEILDHHKNEREDETNISVTIEPVGSCCTLVTEVILNDESVVVPEDLHWLLYGAILLDTVCLSESAGKATSKDIQCVEELEGILPKPNRKSAFDKLQNAKLDISNLETIEILNKDLKIVDNEDVVITISSIPAHLKDFLYREDLNSSLRDFAVQHKAQSVMMMGFSLDDDEELHRQLAVYSEDHSTRDKLAHSLEQRPDLRLDGDISWQKPSPHITAFKQGNVKASRKLILPMIVDILADKASVKEHSTMLADRGNNLETELAAQGNIQSTADELIKTKGEGMEVEDQELDSLLTTQYVKDGTTGNTSNNNGLEIVTLGDKIPTINTSLVDSQPNIEEQKTEENSNTLLDSLDPFGNQASILLDGSPIQTASVTPQSGQSTRSQSPTPESIGLDMTDKNLMFPSTKTPDNTPMEMNMEHYDNQQTDLPSFHSLEMVERIRSKKSSYTDAHDEISEELTNYPFTPSSSYADVSNMEQIAQDQLLRQSLMNEKISEKMSSLSNEENDVTDQNSSAGNNIEQVQISDFIFAESEDEAAEKFTKLVIESAIEKYKLEVENQTSDIIVNQTEQNQSPTEEIEVEDISEVDTNQTKTYNDLSKVEIEDVFPLGSSAKDSARNCDILEHFPASGSSGDDQSNCDILPERSELAGAILASDKFVNPNGAELFDTQTEMIENEKDIDTELKDEYETPNLDFDLDSRATELDSLNLETNSIDLESNTVEQVDPEPTEIESELGKEILHVDTQPHDTESKSEQESLSHGSGHLGTKSETEPEASDVGLESVNVAAEQETLNLGFKPVDSKSEVMDFEAIHLGPEPGESYTEENIYKDKNEFSKQVIEQELTDKAVAEQVNDGMLILGSDPGESSTEVSNTKPNVSVDTDKYVTPKVDEDGFVHLGIDPGESCTESGTFTDYMQSKGMDISQGMETEAKINAPMEILSRSPLDGSTKPIRSDDSPGRATSAIIDHDVKASPDVSTAKVKSIKQNDNRTSKKMKDDSLTEQQRSHLEGVRKALDIDLSSEDEDEVKTKKDQAPKEFRSIDIVERQVERPTTLNTTKKKILPNLDLLNSNDIDIATSPTYSTDDDIGISIDDEKTPDDLTTPDVLNSSMFDGELEWGSTASSTPVEPIPEYSAREEFEDERHWRSVQIGDKWYKIDMKVIEPYKKVLSHGGYYGDGFNAIVVFTACYLPDRRRRDYHYVMDNLFLYVISTLELLVVDDYMIVYFHGSTPRHKMPSLRWLKRCYDMIDRRLRKNLKGLLVVHPTIWLKTLVFMTKPFISSKFSSKMRYIKNLEALAKAIPTEYIYIPDEVKKYDELCRSNPPSNTA